ncbi:MAG TPA: protein sip-5 [Stenotrophomonas sp.]|jgi:hypothetical protein
MNFNQLRHRVDRAEHLVHGRADDTEVHWGTLQRVWRQGWTPLRIVGAGLITGFLAGKLEPSKGKLVANQATRWVQMFSTVSGLITAMQAQHAAQQTEAAGEQAERAADSAQAVAEGEVPVAPASGARSANLPRDQDDDLLATAPRPAEAATELSER